MAINLEKKDCCGCQVCMNICPKQCISMQPDDEGFLYPCVDHETCIECGLCEKRCPAVNRAETANEFEQKVFACWNLDPDTRINSTSGGIISALSEKVIEAGGYVVGAYYKDDFTVAHMIGSNSDDINLLRQSKYLQSDTGMIYQAVKNALKTGKTVLFCGTPCHNAALRNYLIKIPDNLIQCDFICRGVISPKVFTCFLEYLEKKYHGKVTKVQFKNKDFGWNRFSTKIRFDNGAEYIKDRYHDPYMVSYLRYSVSLRPSCYECKYKGSERFADITVGDFWGIGALNPELDENKGTSLVIINSQKGRDAFDSIGDTVFYEERAMADIPGGNMCFTKSPKPGKFRELFFKDLGKKSFGSIYKRYVFRRKLDSLSSKTKKLFRKKQ